MPFVPEPNLCATLDRLLEQRIMRFRDDLSLRTNKLKADDARRGASGTAAAWKLWAFELDHLPQLVENEALTLLEECGVKFAPAVREWLAPVLEGHLDAVTRGLTREAEALFPNRGFTRLIAEFMQRMKARLESDLTVKAQRAALRGTARLDPMLPLLHRGAFDEDLPAALGQMERAQKHLALVFLDLDRFKELNDAHGHQAGDDALVAFADRVKATLGDLGAVYRYGGDEFAILVPDCPREAGEALAARLRNAVVHEPLTPLAVSLDVSFGVAIFPDDGTTADVLVGKADAAMYAQKKGRRRP